MIIEAYLDASQLAPSQALVIIDDHGKRWDVLEALNSSQSSTGSDSPRIQDRRTDVVLERWKLELKCPPSDDQGDDFGPTLPTIYKRSIVFFRSLFVTTRVMPAWKFSQTSMLKGVHPSLEVKCRIYPGGAAAATSADTLRQPLFDGKDAVTDYVFGDLEVPVGRFYASVTYRNDCNFRVDDSESLLSSRFMGADEQYFRPSFSQRNEQGRRDSTAEVGSLPSHRHNRHLSDIQQTYGSLSTFHGAGPLGTSPISALKAVRAVGSDTSSPPGSVPASVEQDIPHSLPIAGRSSTVRPSLRSVEVGSRRPSVSFQPFKAGSLSGSPRIQDDMPASPHSLSRQAGLGALAQARNRTSLTAGMAASLRGGPPPSADPGPSSSPKPNTSRFSSSFTHRRGRPSYGGTSRGDDDQGSSGKQSLSSSAAQPGSGLLAEAGGTSSGSFQTEDDNISDFLKALDSKKTLQSFETGKKGEPATKRTITHLSKFQLMKDSNIALTESMNSSVHRSSTSSSRQLTSVPGMVNPASMSASSSPSKPLSPHTPHTPAIPSRLSENSIIDYHAQVQAARARAAPGIDATEEEREAPPVSQEGTTAIDIPLSPRLLQPNRRSSSVAQQSRAVVEDDDPDLPFGGQRSLSLGADDRDVPTTLSALLRMERVSEGNGGLQPPADIRASSHPRASSSAEEGEGKAPSRSTSSATPRLSYRHRYRNQAEAHGRGSSPPQSSPLNSAGLFAPRYSAPARGTGDGEVDDEPLMFTLSEIGQGNNRRSIEEGRGGGRGAGAGSGSGSGSGYGDRGGYDSSRGAGSRRGWR